MEGAPLRCTKCSFNVNRFEGYRWSGVDYLFFRNYWIGELDFTVTYTPVLYALLGLIMTVALSTQTLKNYYREWTRMTITLHTVASAHGNRCQIGKRSSHLASGVPRRRLRVIVEMGVAVTGNCSGSSSPLQITSSDFFVIRRSAPALQDQRTCIHMYVC